MSRAAKKPQKPRFSWLVVALSGLLVAATLLCYLPAFQAEFIDFDDGDYVTENEHVYTGLSGDNLVWAMTKYYSSNWHPLTWTSHMLDVELFGIDPRGHHAMNVALHALNVVLLFLLLRAMTGDLVPSFIVAGLFAIHPVNVESVAWIAQRKTTLSTLFGILAIGAYARYVRQANRRAYVVSLVCYALSLMSKQMLVTLPFALLLLDYWPLERKEFEAPKNSRPTFGSLARGWWKLFPEKLPYLALAILSSIVTVIVQQQSIRSVDSYPIAYRLGNVSIAYVRYLVALAWPFDLAIFYPLYVDEITIPKVLASMVVLLAITAAAAWLGLRWRYLLVGWFWYLGTMVPVIGLVHVGLQSMADRYAYVTFWGLFIVIVWGGRDLLRCAAERLAGRTPATQQASAPVKLAPAKQAPARQTPARQAPRTPAFGPGSAAIAVMLLAMFAGLGWLTYQQTTKWRTTIALFEDALADTDRNWQAHSVLASHYLSDGDIRQAIEHCQRGIECGRDLGRLYGNYGLALFQLGSSDAAIDKLTQSTKVDPKNAWGPTNLGWMYNELGKYDLAIQNLQAAGTRLKPTDTRNAKFTVYANWGTALAKSNRREEARQKFEQALSVDPSHRELLRDAAANELALGDVARAADYLRRALTLDGNDADATFLLARCFARQNDVTQAVAAYERTIGLNPRNLEAVAEWAQLMPRVRPPEQAQDLFTKMLPRLESTEDKKVLSVASVVHTQLAQLAKARKDSKSAIEQYGRAIEQWPDNAQATRELAWLLATSADGHLRDPQRALTLARRAAQLQSKADAPTLATLAAALAASGDMPQAVDKAREALSLSKVAGDPERTAALERQLALYEQGKPLIEP